MPLRLDDSELLELMKNFYVLTGLRMVLFDENYNEIISYPEERQPFCECMRQNKEFDSLCRKSDKASFEACRKSQKLVMYKCHAGLFEATAPITDGGSTIGYIMFGQTADKKQKDEFLERLSEICKKYPMPNAPDKIEKIKYKSLKQLEAAAKILEVCTSYILNKELIRPSRIHLKSSIDEYISKHLSEEITVSTLCKNFNISRTRLYEAMKPYIDGGIATYVRKKRLSQAKHLLKSTDIPIPQISDKVGFSDYNYFLRAFKKEFGISPKQLQSKYTKS